MPAGTELPPRNTEPGEDVVAWDSLTADEQKRVRPLHGVLRGDGPHDRRQRRRDPRRARAARPARQHHLHLHQRQRRLPRGRSPGQHRLLPRRQPALAGHHHIDDDAGPAGRDRRPDHLAALPTRLGDGLQHAVPAVQDLHVPRRPQRPVRRLLAARHRRRPDPAPVHPRHRRPPDARPALGLELLTSRNGPGRRPARRRHLRPDPRRRRAPRRTASSTTSASATAPSTATAGTPSPSTSHEAVQPGPLAPVRHRDRLDELDDLADQHPELVAELVDAWEQAAWANRVFPLDEGAASSTSGGHVGERRWAVRSPPARHADARALPLLAPDRRPLVPASSIGSTGRATRASSGARRAGVRLRRLRRGRQPPLRPERSRRDPAAPVPPLDPGRESCWTCSERRRNLERPAPRRRGGAQPRNRPQLSVPAVRGHRHRHRSALSCLVGALPTPQAVPFTADHAVSYEPGALAPEAGEQRSRRPSTSAWGSTNDHRHGRASRTGTAIPDIPVHMADVDVRFVVPGSDEETNRAVADFSIDVRRGEFVVLVVGRSGCGKTTVLNLVAGLVQPPTGEIAVMGKTPSTRGPHRLHVRARRAAALAHGPTQRRVRARARRPDMKRDERRPREGAARLLGLREPISSGPGSSPGHAPARRAGPHLGHRARRAL